MYPIKQSTAETVLFFAYNASGDAVTGLADGGFTKRISKGSGAFAAMTVTITEMENGWYSFPLSTTHSNTVGILTVSFLHASIKQVNLQWRVSAKTFDELSSQASLDAMDDLVDTEVADIKTVVDAILLDTAEIGAAGVGLTNVSIATAGIDAAALAADALNAIADANLDRNMATGTDNGTNSTAVRTPRQALRAVRNKVTIAAGTLTVTKENDTTTSWTAAVTTAAGNPISGVDPT